MFADLWCGCCTGNRGPAQARPYIGDGAAFGVRGGGFLPGDGFAVGVEGGVELRFGFEDQAEIIFGFGVAGIEVDRAGERFVRFADALTRVIGAAEKIPGFLVLWIELDGFFEPLDGVGIVVEKDVG